MTVRVLHITSTPPLPSFGGAMTFFRHFCELDDFKIAVVTDEALAGKQSYPSLILSPSRLFDRLSRTRLSRWVHGIRLLSGGCSVSADVLRFSQEFRPDAVFTVAGAWSRFPRLAERIAKRMRIPLIGSFNDWWNYNQIYHPMLHKTLERQFLNFYQRCDLAICTSEGMQEALGEHRNSTVIYPTGAKFCPNESFSPPNGGPLKVGFGGNLGDWYGPMLEALVVEVENRMPSEFQFRFFGSRPSWSPDFGRRAIREGIFLGQVDFPSLTTTMRSCDTLLLPMGFNPAIRQIESTSFKTKFLDYLTFEKPILVWGPEYCSAVRTAREFDSAEVCVSERASDVAEALCALKSDPGRQSRLVANARAMYLDRFHPDRLHKRLVEKIGGLLR